MTAETDHPRSTVERCDLLLTDGVVITMDDHDRIMEPGWVAIRGDRIVSVGGSDELTTGGIVADRTIDCRGAAVVPGFVSAHDHLFQNIARGLGDGLDFREWLPDFMVPLAAGLEAADAVAAVTMAALEQVLCGTTAVLDHHYAGTDLDTTLAVAGAVERVGMRGAIGRGLGPEQPYPVDEQFAIMEAAIDARPGGSHVEVWPAPGDIIYNDQDMVVRAVELARARGIGWHTHCCQYKTDQSVYRDRYGVGPIAWMAEAGVLGPDAHIAHMIFLDDEEVELVGGTSSRVAYCPVSHGVFGLGSMRLADLRRAGAVVGLGYDGAVAGFRNDMFEQMKTAVIIQRLAALEPDRSDPYEALSLATREGARYLGLDAGQLVPGKLADLAVVNISGPHHTPRADPISAVAFSARSSDVRHTVIGGRVVVEDGRCTTVDETEVMRRAVEARNRVEARLDLPIPLPVRRVSR